MNALRKGMVLSCVVIAFETESDANYNILHYLATLNAYKNVPVLVLINSQDQQFRAKLAKRTGVTLLNGLTTSPKRLVEEVKALIG